MTPETEARKFWADGTPATLDPTALVAEMDRVWRECMKYDRRPTVMCIPGGLWLRVDGWVSDDLRVWREPEQADKVTIAAFRVMLSAQEFAFAEPAAPKFLPVEPVHDAPVPVWHQFRGSRRR